MISFTEFAPHGCQTERTAYLYLYWTGINGRLTNGPQGPEPTYRRCSKSWYQSRLLFYARLSTHSRFDSSAVSVKLSTE